jgi:CheY-like chemotaxis protein
MKFIKILLVRDDSVSTVDIKSRLDKMPLYYTLHSKESGKDALVFLENELERKGMLPDIVLIDSDLRDMNSLDLLSAVRGREELKHLKCFIISTSDKKIDEEEVKKLGMSAYILDSLKLSNPSSIDAFNLIIDLMNMKAKDVSL